MTAACLPALKILLQKKGILGSAYATGGSAGGGGGRTKPLKELKLNMYHSTITDESSLTGSGGGGGGGSGGGHGHVVEVGQRGLGMGGSMENVKPLGEFATAEAETGQYHHNNNHSHVQAYVPQYGLRGEQWYEVGTVGTHPMATTTTPTPYAAMDPSVSLSPVPSVQQVTKTQSGGRWREDERGFVFV